jgi:hypothetical protein
LWFTPIAAAASRSVIGASPITARNCAATSTAIRRPFASSGIRPSVKTATSRRATTYVLYRGPQTWTSDGSSQVVGPVPATRAWMDSSAALGMLSCNPAHAARWSDAGPAASRSSRAPTARRKARICSRLSVSRGPVTAFAPPEELSIRPG